MERSLTRPRVEGTRNVPAANIVRFTVSGFGAEGGREREKSNLEGGAWLSWCCGGKTVIASFVAKNRHRIDRWEEGISREGA